MALEPDIVEKIRSDFQPEESERALDLIRESGKAGRIARCIVVASRGSLDSLQNHIRLANSDFNDAIMAGEYDATGRQARDLRVSFLMDTPQRFWVGQVACMMASRGYMLSSLTTRAAAVPPFDYPTDFNEPMRHSSARKASSRWRRRIAAGWFTVITTNSRSTT
jgi:hypothetical protein